jgi:selenocysteine-specific elongation factor
VPGPVQVVATAGHVDHGKSTLVRALTGMEPDRWEAERRRGLTIDLGFAWTRLPGGETVAFVDVPGHQRFVSTMLAGVGPVPAVLFVVAADEGWMPQSREHLDALAALGVRHGLLVITRTDLLEPDLALEEAREQLAGTSLAGIPAVPVSAATGEGLDELRAELSRLVRGLPRPGPGRDVRLWLDRAFTIRGAGTVVTGTLAEGRLRVGDELLLRPGDRAVGVRGLHSMDAPIDEVTGVARVAVNLRGLDREVAGRGAALLTPGRWLAVDTADVRLRPVHPDTAVPVRLTLHVGSAAVPVRLRPLGADTARLTTAEPLPLRIGDRALLRDPGAHRIVAGLTVLDVRPPGLTRRGDAARRAEVLRTMDGVPDPDAELARRGLVRAAELVAMGAGSPSGADVRRAGDWLVHPDRAAAWGVRCARTTTSSRSPPAWPRRPPGARWTCRTSSSSTSRWPPRPGWCGATGGCAGRTPWTPGWAPRCAGRRTRCAPSWPARRSGLRRRTGWPSSGWAPRSWPRWSARVSWSGWARGSTCCPAPSRPPWTCSPGSTTRSSP